ncbi:hypothetical protein [Pasteurella multocida]|nr:hypothetical protein [Pasteurella multocida]
MAGVTRAWCFPRYFWWDCWCAFA